MTRETTKLILHAEDEPAHAAIIRMIIEQSSINVQLKQVADGKDALDYLYRRGLYEDPTTSPRPNLILLDLRMPRISGLECLAIVKKDSGLMAIPVVIFTTSDLEKDRAEAYACHASSYLTKPADFELFVETVQTLCARWLG